jgi:hypothetical protein
VSIDVTPVNDPPVASIDLTTQALQYSDGIQPVTVSAADVDAGVLIPSTRWAKDDGAATAGLPVGLSLAGSCSGSSPVSCTFILSGRAMVSEGDYDIEITLTDDGYPLPAQSVTLLTTINVEPEDASVNPDGDNPVAVLVSEPKGDSGPFTLTAYVRETFPEPSGIPFPGDIDLASLSMTLVPVGPGGSASPTGCSRSITGTGYDAILTVTCSFNEVPVNTYTLEMNVSGGYYLGGAEDVVTIYDPSLGFATGGGWFYWPGTTDKTNFGFTMKYNKKGLRLRGSLLLIRHLDDGTIYRVKSNALFGLSIGVGDEGGETFGWASFSGKNTYLEPGWPEPIGNYEFITYVEDRNEPGTGVDRVWLQVMDKDNIVIPVMSMNEPATDNAEEISGGNIVAPH